jgi:hypothetical protein
MLRTTVGSFDHAVFLNGVEPSMFKQSIVVGRNASPRPLNLGHLDGLSALVSYCLEHPHEYYLILDSDAFPVRGGWIKLLRSRLENYGKLYAAPVRVENLDLFPHPCAVFTCDPSCLAFDIQPSNTLLGQVAGDLSCTAPKESWFPLLKSNRTSVHPILATIYYDVFYHHGNGSRPFATRATLAGYYDHVLDQDESASSRCQAPEEVMASFQRDPLLFIKRLR